jgi:thioredoxin reductase
LKTIETAIIGGGPYGLSLATQLGAKGVPYRIFGEAMRSWKQMPKGMFLKSLGFATSIATPQKGMDFPSWLAARGLETFEPCSYAHFAEYGIWVQNKLVPTLEQTDVTRLASKDGVFSLTLETGEELTAKQVVVAIGLGPFQRLPQVLQGFPRALVSHTFGHADFAQFAGKEVAVLGAGQSALEAAVLLYEQGAKPTLIVRGPGAKFFGKLDLNRSIVERLRNPLSVLGPGRKNWMMEKFPWALHFAPDDRRVKLARTYLGPVGSWWLRDRFAGKVSELARTAIASARETGGEITLGLREASGTQSERRFAHVICGTGFEHDLDKLTFIDSGLRGRIDRVQTAPRLSSNFETSVSGLYFIGPLSAYSFGPLFRFVCGDEYAAPHVARKIVAAASKPSVSAAA